MPLNGLNTRTIDRSGGTILHSTRTNPANIRVEDLPPHLQHYAEGHDPNERVDLTNEVLANISNMWVPESGPPDPYGHRKKTNIAEFLADQLSKCLPRVRFLSVDLTYLLRSGEPDVYDKHMAIYYANLIRSAIADGAHGIMAAHRDGDFVYTDVPGKDLPPRRVDPTDYHPTRYRPRFEHIKGIYRPTSNRSLPLGMYMISAPQPKM